MNVGILSDSIEEAQQLASWLQLWVNDWRHLPPDTDFTEVETGVLVLAIDQWPQKEAMPYVPERIRVIKLSPLGIGERLMVCGIIAFARKQSVELTLEELQHFTASGFAVLVWDQIS